MGVGLCPLLDGQVVTLLNKLLQKSVFLFVEHHSDELGEKQQPAAYAVQ